MGDGEALVAFADAVCSYDGGGSSRKEALNVLYSDGTLI